MLLLRGHRRRIGGGLLCRGGLGRRAGGCGGLDSAGKGRHGAFLGIGHSERRGYFGETDEDVNRKAHALVDKGVWPIMCCGESLECRDEGKTLEFVCAQVRAGLAGLQPEQAAKCVVAYEPIWAIGTGRTATPQQAQEVCAAIRATLAELFGQQTADNMRILYGGSMKPENVGLFLPMEDIDGGLIGGAALDADSFAELVRAAE